jgi:hypothetical protein
VGEETHPQRVRTERRTLSGPTGRARNACRTSAAGRENERINGRRDENGMDIGQRGEGPAHYLEGNESGQHQAGWEEGHRGLGAWKEVGWMDGWEGLLLVVLVILSTATWVCFRLAFRDAQSRAVGARKGAYM